MIPEGERPIIDVIAGNVEKYRKERNMSKQKLCIEADYGYQSYQKLIKGKTEPRPTTIQRLAFVLGVKTLDLIEDWGSE